MNAHFILIIDDVTARRAVIGWQAVADAVIGRWPCRRGQWPVSMQHASLIALLTSPHHSTRALDSCTSIASNIGKSVAKQVLLG